MMTTIWMHTHTHRTAAVSDGQPDQTPELGQALDAFQRSKVVDDQFFSDVDGIDLASHEDVLKAVHKQVSASSRLSIATAPELILVLNRIL